MLPFSESYFCVTWRGDGATSAIIKGWSNVVKRVHEDAYQHWQELDSTEEVLFDPDNWDMENQLADEDSRFRLIESFEDCQLSIQRITEPFEAAK